MFPFPSHSFNIKYISWYHFSWRREEREREIFKLASPTHKDYEFLMFQQQYVLRQLFVAVLRIIRPFQGIRHLSSVYIHIKLPHPQLLFIDYDLHHSSIHNI